MINLDPAVIAAIPALPPGSFRWLPSDDADAEPGAPDHGCLREDRGDYQTFARILFKLNGYRPGPVRGWYVVVCIAPQSCYVVGQMRADAATPVQLFSDLRFGTEAEARLRAAQMRSNRQGARRRDDGPT